jgi:hypothetical protein
MASNDRRRVYIRLTKDLVRLTSVVEFFLASEGNPSQLPDLLCYFPPIVPIYSSSTVIEQFTIKSFNPDSGPLPALSEDGMVHLTSQIQSFLVFPIFIQWSSHFRCGVIQQTGTALTPYATASQRAHFWNDCSQASQKRGCRLRIRGMMSFLLFATTKAMCDRPLGIRRAKRHLVLSSGGD